MFRFSFLQATIRANKSTASGFFLAGKSMTWLPVSSGAVILLYSHRISWQIFLAVSCSLPTCFNYQSAMSVLHVLHNAHIFFKFRSIYCHIHVITIHGFWKKMILSWTCMLTTYTFLNWIIYMLCLYFLPLRLRVRSSRPTWVRQLWLGCRGLRPTPVLHQLCSSGTWVH